MCRTCGRPLGSAAEKKVGRHEDCPAPYDEALFARLKEWRSSTARTLEKPAFVVFPDATLEAIAERRPSSRSDLLRVPGVGDAKLTAYGDEVLAIVAGNS
jgi:DNA helicase-2/ATP-dependent DNA helicase PcrA